MSPVQSEPAARAAQHTSRRAVHGAVLRRSMWLMTYAWCFGALWMFTTNGPAATKLINHFKQDDLLLGVLTAAGFIGVMAQIPGALFTQWYGSRKVPFLVGMIIHRGMYSVMGLLPWVLPSNYQPAAVTMLVILIISNLLGHFSGQNWVNWVADMVPERIRGKYFSLRSRIGLSVGMISLVVMGVVLDSAQNPLGWFYQTTRTVADFMQMPWMDHPLSPLVFTLSLVFVVAGISGAYDIVVFLDIPEPPMRPAPKEPVLQGLLRPLRDSNFRRYLTYMMGFNFSNMFFAALLWQFVPGLLQERALVAPNFYNTHPILATIVCMQLAFHIGQYCGYPIWGRLIDRYSKRAIIFVSAAAHSLSLIFWAILQPDWIPLGIAVQMFGGFFFAGQEVTNFNLMLGFTKSGGPRYQSVGAVVMNLAGAVGGITAGLAAKSLYGVTFDLFPGTVCYLHLNHYHMVMLMAFAPRLFSDLILLSRVHDVQTTSRRVVVRYVVGDVYNNISQFVGMTTRMNWVPELLRPWQRNENEATDETPPARE